MRLIASILVFLLSTPVIALESKPVLSLSMAQKMADACEAKAQKEGLRKVNIGIYDDGGNLKLFRRQDGAFMHIIQVSQLKGWTSGGSPGSTRAFVEINYSNADKPYWHRCGSGLCCLSGWLTDTHKGWRPALRYWC